MERLLTHGETARFLNVSQQTLTRLGDEGKLAFHRVGVQRRYAPSDVQTYLDSNRQPAAAQKVAA